MFTTQGGDGGLKKKETALKENIVDDKKIIAEYDEVLSVENENSESHLGKLELLKQKLGLNSDNTSSDLKTNLIDNDDVATFVDWKSSLNIFVSYILLFLIFLGGTLAYLTFLEKEKEKKVSIYDEDIKKTKEQIIREEELVEKGLLFQKKVDILNNIIDEHIYWTKLFSYIEKNTLEDVSYEKFSGKLDGIYALSGSANKLYFTAAEQIKTFKQDELTEDVSVNELTFSKSDEGSSVGFNMKLSVKKDIFYKNNK